MNFELIVFKYFLKGALYQKIKFDTIYEEISPRIEKNKLVSILYNLGESNIVYKLEDDEYVLSKYWYESMKPIFVVKNTGEKKIVSSNDIKSTGYDYVDDYIPYGTSDATKFPSMWISNLSTTTCGNKKIL